jgi:hypothetical protein
MPQVRSGSYTVVEQRHTVLLGWNKQMAPVLRQVGSCWGCCAWLHCCCG